MNDVIFGIVVANLFLTLIISTTSLAIWLNWFIKNKSKSSKIEIENKINNYKALLNSTDDAIAKSLLSEKIDDLTNSLKSRKK